MKEVCPGSHPTRVSLDRRLGCVCWGAAAACEKRWWKAREFFVNGEPVSSLTMPKMGE